jgi:hypothetical protein
VEDTNMSSKVYSAARAFFPLHGKLKEQAWKELTNMFYDDAEKEKSFVVLGFPLKCVNRRRPDEISVGDTFKHSSAMTDERYIIIVECTPYESFAYDEKYMPTSGEDIEEAYKYDSRRRMEFFLRSHPEATLVEIRRRHKGHRSLFDKLTERRTQDAASMLRGVITGRYGRINEMTLGELTIKRDDSYRIDF